MSDVELTAEQRAMVNTFVRTGNEGDELRAPWHGNILERASSASHALRAGLVAEIRRREGCVALPAVPAPAALHAMTRERVEPMVRGLFPKKEHDIVLELLEKSVVFLTPNNIEAVIHGESFGSAAWDLANLYLASIDAELLSDEARGILGYSQETTCFVTARYLEGRGRFDDYLVHEAAHVFHNWKRERCGLPHTRRREWLLPIAFQMRETFAYTCEVFSRIVEQGRTKNEREALFAEYEADPLRNCHGLDVDQHLVILREAVAARNGWKRILAKCSE